MLILDCLCLNSDELIGNVEITLQTHDQGHLGCLLLNQWFNQLLIILTTCCYTIITYFSLHLSTYSMPQQSQSERADLL